MKYLDFFEEVYYINLDYRTDRKEKFEKRASEVGIVPVRFSAFHPNIEDCYKIWEVDGNKDMLTRTKEQQRLKANEVGCAMSHMQIIRNAKEKELENVFIFEDDCVFLDNFKEEIEKVVDDIIRLNLKWDVLFFGGEPNDYCIKVTDNISYLKVGGVYGLQSYAVNKSYYDIFLENKYYGAMDIYILHNNRENSNFYLSKKLLTIQETNHSDLRNHIVSTPHFIKGWENFVINEKPFKGGDQRYDFINFLIKKYNYTSFLEIVENTFGSPSILSNLSISNKKSVDNLQNINDKFDIIFIDGNHEYQNVLNDILNSLKILNNNGIIFLHDCNPTNENMTKVNPGSYLGEVYKAYINVVKTFNFEYYTIDADWGCGIIKPNLSIDFNIIINKIIENWNFFESNRNQLLNLISEEFFYNSI